jgi:hypothetical protein
MLRSLLSCGALCLAVVSLGCAEMTYGPRKLADETVVSTRHKILPSPTSRATLQQTGTEIRITTTQACDLVEVKEVKRTYEQEKENPALVPELVLLSLGAVPAGIGAAFLVDSQNVYENDRNARLYNASGKSGAVAAGVVFLTWGAVMIAVPLVDLARSGGSKEDEETATENGQVLRRDIPCEGGVAPAGYRPVMGRILVDTFHLGNTDPSGVLVADLAQVVPPRIFLSPQPATSMEVLVDNVILGKVSLAGVGEAVALDWKKREAMAWAEVDAIACRSAPPDHPACDEVRSYLQQFPNGPHVQDARRLLDPSTRSGSVQVAVSPEDLAKAEAAKKAAGEAAKAGQDAARKAALEACRKKCEASCKKEATCSSICVAEACK